MISSWIRSRRLGAGSSNANSNCFDFILPLRLLIRHAADHSVPPTVRAFSGLSPSASASRLVVPAAGVSPDDCVSPTMPFADFPKACASGISRGHPVCFRCVAAGSTPCAIAITGGLTVVLHPRPWARRLESVCCTLARIFASGFLKVPSRVFPLLLATLRRYLAGSGL
jgi:hypothetical protein